MNAEAREATAESAQRRMAIEYMRFDGFDEYSPTLEQSPAVGTCMRSWWDVRRWPTVIKDPAVACRSGDLVQLLERGRDGQYRTIIKELRCTRDRKWWAVCDDGVFQIGALYRPSAMTRVVALSTRDWGLNHDAPVTGATPAELAQLNALAGTVRAVAEWKAHGFERGVPFPGLYVVNIPDPTRTDLPTTREDPRNGLGVIVPMQLTVSTPSYDQPIAPTNLTATGIVQGVLLTWDAPSPRNTRQVYHVYQHTANTPFGSATRVMTVNGLETVIQQVAGVTRFFWVTGELNGFETAGVPVGNGVSGTPSTAGTPDLTPESATEVYRIEEFGSDGATPSWEDKVSVTIDETSIVTVDARCNSCFAGGSETATWTPFVGGADGFSVTTDDGTVITNAPVVTQSFVVSPGTYDIGMRATASAGIVSVNDRIITICVIKR